MANYHLARATRPKRFSEHVAEAGERYEARLKSDADVQSLQDDQRLRTILQESGGDLDAAATAAAAAGIDPRKVSDLETRAFGRVERKRKVRDWANSDQDRTRRLQDEDAKRALAKFDAAAKIGEAADSVIDGDDASYQAWRQAAMEAARANGFQFEAPEHNDPAFMAKVRASAAKHRQSWTILNDHQKEALGVPTDVGIAVDRTGKPTKFYEPPRRQQDVETWSPLTPEQAAAEGYPDGSVVQRSNRGRRQAAYTPRNNGRSGGLTHAQEAANVEVDEARRLVKRLSKDDLIARTRQYTETGAPNPAYDPTLAATVRKALKRKVGVNDPEFEVVSKQFRGAAETPAPRAPAELSDDELMQSLGLGR